MEEMISEKNERDEASSSCSNTVSKTSYEYKMANGQGIKGSARIGRFFSLTLGMLVAKSALAHVRQLDSSLGAGVHEPVTANWVKLGCCNDLGKFLHVGRLDIHNVEALVLDVEVPQVDPEIVTADEGLAITVHGDAIDMIRVGVGIRSPWDGGNDGIMVCQARHLESSSILEGSPRCPGKATTTHGTSRSHLIRQVVLSHHLERLVEYLPKLYGLVVCGEEEVGCILSSTPFYLVDLLFDL
jgi:hypothetical protein